MNTNVAILGAGSWGTALAIQLCNLGHKVDIWTRSQEDADNINEKREQKKYLPDVLIPTNISCYTDIERVLRSKEIIVVAIPSQHIRENLKNIKTLINSGQIIVSVTKGIEENSLMRMSQVINQEVPGSKIAILSGPSHAEEVAKNIPTTIVSASEDLQIAKKIQDVFMSPSFRVYTNSDLIGVEIGGALKNVIALCAGISDGLGFGDNTKAALMTRGITEIARLGSALGARKQTFAGLTGMGDLIVTCTSMHSRNRRAGMLIGQGKSVEEALKEIKMVVEGVRTTRAAHNLSNKFGVEMPIVEQAYKVLFENEDSRQAVMNLMIRDKKHEIEDIFVD